MTDPSNSGLIPRSLQTHPMNQHLKDQIKAVLGALILGAIFIGINYVLQRAGNTSTRGSLIVGENRTPVTAASLALATMAIYASCVVVQCFGWNSLLKRIVPIGEYCHLFSLTAIWLTTLMACRSDGFSTPAAIRLIVITIYLGALHWMATSQSVTSRVLAVLLALGFAALFALATLGTASVLLSS